MARADKAGAPGQTKITSMEGVLFVIKAWALAGIGLWVYRRWFERVSGPDLEFEAWCSTRPVIAALHGNGAELSALAESLRARLGARRRAVATLGGWPWPYYALELGVDLDGSVVRLRVLRTVLRRTREAECPRLLELLQGALGDHPGTVDDTWLYPATVVKAGGPDEARHGWRLEGGAGPRPRTTAHATSPSWLSASAPLPAPLKLLGFGAPVLEKTA